jgi:spore cortex formation protein SpoVR/YcgB (stage V sporulation)
MLMDIKRMCQNPDDEDRKWCPDICGKEWLPTILNIVENYRDESFVLQYLSPKVINQFKLFSLHMKEYTGFLEVNATQEDIYDLRAAISAQYDLSRSIPHIEIVKVDWDADRNIYLEHRTKNGRRLTYRDAKKTMNHIFNLWGFTAHIEYVDMEGKPLDEV